MRTPRGFIVHTERPYPRRSGGSRGVRCGDPLRRGFGREDRSDGLGPRDGDPLPRMRERDRALAKKARLPVTQEKTGARVGVLGDKWGPHRSGSNKLAHVVKAGVWNWAARLGFRPSFCFSLFFSYFIIIFLSLFSISFSIFVFYFRCYIPILDLKHSSNVDQILTSYLL